MNMFEEAARRQLRFKTVGGLVSAEDLFRLPLTGNKKLNLDEVAKGINRELKDATEESFVKKQSTSPTNQLRMDIVKHIIAVKLQEEEDVAKAAERKARKDKLIAVLGRKQDAELEEMSVEDIQKEIAAL